MVLYNKVVETMVTRKQVLTQIKKMGCTVDEKNRDDDLLVIDAPRGKVFACINSHCLIQPLVDEFNPKPRSEAYTAILSDLSYGLKDCEDPECDICHSEEE